MKKFDILYESVMTDLLMEENALYKWLTKTWTLKEEFKALIPLLLKKIKLSFGSFYSDGRPGPPSIVRFRTNFRI
jgi:hypothetical protein